MGTMRHQHCLATIYDFLTVSLMRALASDQGMFRYVILVYTLMYSKQDALVIIFRVVRIGG